LRITVMVVVKTLHLAFMRAGGEALDKMTE
jgi:hypothetical protein